ncbi:MAG: hypothetical protein Q605_AUC00918G0007, partial [Actinomyces urogenitalis DORA_12]
MGRPWVSVARSSLERSRGSAMNPVR